MVHIKYCSPVKEFIDDEIKFGMDDFNRHKTIKLFINETKDKIHDFISPLIKDGKKIAAYGTSNRSNHIFF